MKKLYFTLLTLLSFSISFAQITDGGFETGVGGGAWTEASTNFGTPICDAAGCGTCGGPCVPRSGTYYVWFGGAGAVETGSVEQSATIPSGTQASINMEIKIPTPGPGLIADRMDVSIDGNIVGTITSHDSTAYLTSYVMTSFDISAYADGNTHAIRLEGYQTTASGWNILVDNISLTIDGTPLALNDFENASVHMYPNPAKDIVNIGFASVEGVTTIEITDINGRVVSSQDVQVTNGKVYQMDLDGYSNGVYSVNVLKDGTVLYNEKLVVTK